MRWHPCYLGSTSAYDVWWIATCNGLPTWYVRKHHQSLYRHEQEWRSQVHVAGVMAYTIEMLVAAAPVVVVA